MKKVKDLLTDESRWCQGTAAQDKDGISTPCNYNNPDLCRVCLYGAVRLCYGNDSESVLTQIRVAIVGSVGAWNDTHTFKEVRELIERLDI